MGPLSQTTIGKKTARSRDSYFHRPVGSSRDNPIKHKNVLFGPCMIRRGWFNVNVLSLLVVPIYLYLQCVILICVLSLKGIRPVLGLD